MKIKDFCQGALAHRGIKQTYIFRMDAIVDLLDEMREYYTMYGKFERPELSLVCGDEGVALITENIIEEGKCYAIYAEGSGPDDEDNYGSYLDFLCGCEMEEELTIDDLLRQAFFQGGSTRLVLQFDDEPYRVTCLRESLKVLSTDTKRFVDLLWHPETKRLEEWVMNRMEDWEDIFRWISRKEVEDILQEYISGLPEDVQWICRNALNMFYAGSFSWDDAYGLPGLEAEVKLQFDLEPNDSLATLRQVFTIMRKRRGIMLPSGEIDVESFKKMMRSRADQK